MTLRRFQRLLEAYGADPARWPADECAGAQALLARSTEARALLREAVRLDSLLDALEVEAEPPPAEQLVLLATAAPQQAPARRPPPFGAWRAAMVGSATALTVALALVWFDPLPEMPMEGDVVLVAFGLDGLDD